MNCKDCKYYNPITGLDGECRRHPPVMAWEWIWFRVVWYLAFPEVQWDMWCGEGKAKKG